MVHDRDAHASRDSNCLSGWNGENRNLVKITKEAMHNPKSFEHVKTTYKVKKNHSIVTIKYRGTNRLNAVVSNTITAEIRIDDSEVLKIY